MQTRLTSVIIGLVLVLSTGSLVYFTKQPVVLPPDQVSARTDTQPTITQPSEITLTQIAQHSSRTSCWSAINGGVYDLTSWIPNHPGGEKTILSICGIDGSDGYNGQHGGRAKIMTILGGFKIGTFTK